MSAAENQYLDTLTDDFFNEIVSKKLAIEPSAFRVRIVYITSACAVGENFVAKIFRARIQLCMSADGAKQTVSVILKVHLNPVQAVKEFLVFPREIKVYGHVLPAFERIYREAGVQVTFGPACLKCETTPYEVIVLNDLNADGYRVIERLTSLDADHLFVVLQKLAQFHAVSMVYRKKNQPDDVDLVRPSMACMPDEIKGFIKTMLGTTIQTFVDTLSETEFGAKYSKMLNQWKDHAFDFMDELSKPTGSGTTVLNHGDLWITNHMYLHDANEKPIDSILIDFQAPFWGSPVYDLLYLLVSSANTEVLIARFDEFIQFYHENLEKNLQILAYDGLMPTLKHLHSDILERGQFGLVCMSNIMALVCVDAKENATVDKFMSPDPEAREFVKRVYANPVYLRKVELLLPFFERRGFLDTVGREP